MSRFLRIKLLPTVILNMMAGVVVSGAEIDPLIFVLLLIQSVALYFFGMGLNDRVDLDRDRKNMELGIAMPRPIPAGEISLQSADRWIMFSLACWGLTCGALYLSLGADSLAGLFTNLATLGFILGYNFGLKYVLFLGPLCMGLVRGSLILSVAATSMGVFPAWDSLVAWLAISMTLYIATVTHYSMEEETARPLALKIRMWSVLLGFSFPFFVTYFQLVDFKVDVGRTLYISAILVISSFLWKQKPPLAPQRTTFLFLSAMTWIDFYFLWIYLFSNQPESMETTQLPWAVEIYSYPAWIILWFFWVTFGLGFRDRGSRPE